MRLFTIRSQRCSNPQYLCTIVFRGCDGLNKNSIIRFTVFDVREKVSQTAVPLGSAEVALGTIQEIPRLRIPLESTAGNAGFITMTTYLPEQEQKYTRSPAKQVEPVKRPGHRRSQSLPPKLGVKLIVPPQHKLALIFANPTVIVLNWLRSIVDFIRLTAIEANSFNILRHSHRSDRTGCSLALAATLASTSS